MQHGLTPEELCDHWVAHAANGSRELTEASCEEWGSRLGVGGGKGGRKREQQTRRVYTKDDIDEL